MKVVVTDAALSDLIGIGRHIARDNPNRAATFVDELQEKCRQLVDIPEAFPLLAGREETGIRRRRHGNYLIFYRISPEAVEILHVLNGAQDYSRVPFPDD